MAANTLRPGRRLFRAPIQWKIQTQATRVVGAACLAGGPALKEVSALRLIEPLATHDEIANAVVDEVVVQVLSGLLETCHVLVAGFLLACPKFFGS